jgi:DNA-binding NtrC family response regulator
LEKLSGEGLILVVDDEEVMRNMATDILQEFGYQAITANDGKQGLACFKKRRQEIKAVILDMAMPVMSGRDAYLEMRKIDTQVKVILASGFLKDERVQEILDLGVCGFIQKPYSVGSLMEELKKVLA